MQADICGFGPAQPDINITDSNVKHCFIFIMVNTPQLLIHKEVILLYFPVINGISV